MIGDREVDTPRLGAAIERIREAVEALQRSGGLDAPPTFFECATAIAFELFREARRRGRGPRGRPRRPARRHQRRHVPSSTAITSIGFDHQAQLGNTLESIAFEKAGIVKAGRAR